MGQDCGWILPFPGCVHHDDGARLRDCGGVHRRDCGGGHLRGCAIHLRGYGGGHRPCWAIHHRGCDGERDDDVHPRDGARDDGDAAVVEEVAVAGVGVGSNGGDDRPYRLCDLYLLCGDDPWMAMALVLVLESTGRVVDKELAEDTGMVGYKAVVVVVVGEEEEVEEDTRCLEVLEALGHPFL